MALAVGTSTFVVGDQYRITTAGSAAFGFQLNVGDFVTYNGTGWDKTDNTDPAVLGTANRVTSTAAGDSSYAIDIAPTYAGQGSITTVGTITSGTWQGTPISVANGGTGRTTPTAGVFPLSFTSASLVGGLLTAPHGLNNEYPQVAVYNDLGKIIYPDDVTATSATVSTIDLTTFVVTGTWHVTAIG